MLQYNWLKSDEGATYSPPSAGYIYPDQGVSEPVEIGYTAPKYSSYNTLSDYTPKTSVDTPKADMTQAQADAISGGIKAVGQGIAGAATIVATNKAREAAQEDAQRQLERAADKSQFEFQHGNISVNNDMERVQMKAEELDLMSQISNAARNVQRAVRSMTYSSDSAKLVSDHINENAPYLEYIKQMSTGEI